jgi:pyridoxal phosphate enzyme (YggS family)
MGFNIDQYEKIKAQLPREVLLLPVSKTKPISDLMEAYNHGVKVFGENYVQELVSKAEVMPKDIQWHFIGHLQSNKVKYIAPFVKMIHGVDSFSLLKEIAKQARKQGRVVEVLLQFYIATEESKFGWSPEDLEAIAVELKNNTFEGAEICGVMGMASFVDDEQTIRKEFRQLKQCFDVLQPLLSERFSVISMGMSGDWPMAVEEGSTLIRLGSVLFGSRN